MHDLTEEGSVGGNCLTEPQFQITKYENEL
jgi:hypothetical protein